MAKIEACLEEKDEVNSILVYTSDSPGGRVNDARPISRTETAIKNRFTTTRSVWAEIETCYSYLESSRSSTHVESAAWWCRTRVGTLLNHGCEGALRLTELVHSRAGKEDLSALISMMA